MDITLSTYDSDKKIYIGTSCGTCIPVPGYQDLHSRKDLDTRTPGTVKSSPTLTNGTMEMHEELQKEIDSWKEWNNH
jgi:hypothetical protein